MGLAFVELIDGVTGRDDGRVVLQHNNDATACGRPINIMGRSQGGHWRLGAANDSARAGPHQDGQNERDGRCNQVGGTIYTHMRKAPAKIREPGFCLTYRVDACSEKHGEHGWSFIHL